MTKKKPDPAKLDPSDKKKLDHTAADAAATKPGDAASEKKRADPNLTVSRPDNFGRTI